MTINRLFILSTLLLLAGVLGVGCGPYRAGQLHGTWKGALLTQEGDTMQIDVEQIRFHFDSDGYTFQSTLNYTEAGDYRVDGVYLFTLDKQRNQAQEKAVIIQQLAKDTLTLQMNENGQERILVLVRE